MPLLASPYGMQLRDLSPYVVPHPQRCTHLPKRSSAEAPSLHPSRPPPCDVPQYVFGNVLRILLSKCFLDLFS